MRQRQPLDKLGGGAWQMRKAKLKKRLLDMADELIRIAAARLVRHAPELIARTGSTTSLQLVSLRRNRGPAERHRGGAG